MKKVIALLLVVLIGAVMVATCPKEEAHRQLLKERFNEAVGQEMNQKLGKTIGSIGSWISKPVVKKTINKNLTVSNYGVVSIGRLKVNDQERIISVGLLNHVFTASAERFQAEIDKAISKKKEA